MDQCARICPATVGAKFSRTAIRLGIAAWLSFTPLLTAGEFDHEVVQALARDVPRTVEQLTEERIAAVVGSASTLEAWAAQRTWELGGLEPKQILEELEHLAAAKQLVDRHREELWNLRQECSAVADASVRRERVRHYLRAAAELIDLAGRLRYALHDAIETASYLLDPHPAEFHHLIRMLIRHRVQVAASTLAYVLLDPDELTGAIPFSAEIKRDVLELCRVSQDPQVVWFLAEFLRQPDVPADLALTAMEVIRELGLPQHPREGRAERNGDVPPPATTAEELQDILQRLASRPASPPWLARRDSVRDWLEERHQRGVPLTGFRWGSAEVARETGY